jgi:hypothetical protein
VYICYDEAQKFENSVVIFIFKGATNNVYSITIQNKHLGWQIYAKFCLGLWGRIFLNDVWSKYT